MPQTGGRVLVASDGVWDAFAKPERVARMSRAWHTEVLLLMRTHAGWLAGRGCSVAGPLRHCPALLPVFGACSVSNLSVKDPACAGLAGTLIQSTMLLLHYLSASRAVNAHAGGRAQHCAHAHADAAHEMLCHAGTAQDAPERLVDAIRRAHGGLKDDTSVIVLDLLPPGRTWPSIAGRKTASRQAAACLCFSPCAPAADWQKLVMQIGLY